jgi:hypothetical protein
VATAKDSTNEEFDNSDNSNIMPDVLSDEGETASMKYLQRKPDPSLRYWEGVAFYKTERALNNSCIRVEIFYRGNKNTHIPK